MLLVRPSRDQAQRRFAIEAVRGAFALHDKIDEVGCRHEPFGLLVTISLVQPSRNHQLEAFGPHLLKLGRRDCRFQRDQMLRPNPGRFGQDLTPTVLAGGFCGQHCEMIRGEGGIMIGGASRKEKIGRIALLGAGLSVEREIKPAEDGFQMMLERTTHAGLSPVLDLQRVSQEALDIHVIAGAEASGNAFTDHPSFEAAEHRLFMIQPRDECRVRIVADIHSLQCQPCEVGEVTSGRKTRAEAIDDAVVRVGFGIQSVFELARIALVNPWEH